MKFFSILTILTLLYGCSKLPDKDIGVQLKANQQFNLQTLKKFSKQKGLYETKMSRSGFHKLATTTPISITDYNDLLIWELAVKEVNTQTGKHCYLVPIKGSTVNSHLSDTISDKGYSMMDFYTDKQTGLSIYAQVREYRPEEQWVAQLSRQKGISTTNNEYIDYKNLLQGEPFNGHVLIYNLSNQLRRLITVRQGRVVYTNLFN